MAEGPGDAIAVPFHIAGMRRIGTYDSRYVAAYTRFLGYAEDHFGELLEILELLGITGTGYDLITARVLASFQRASISASVISES